LRSIRDRHPKARTHLEAPPRPGRELVDSGRRQEIPMLLWKPNK
jgi:hypothetical protein